jgi:hypothetical protein
MASPATVGDSGAVRGFLALIWTLASLSIVVVVARFYTRTILVRKVALDDWLMLISLVSCSRDRFFTNEGISANILIDFWSSLRGNADCGLSTWLRTTLRDPGPGT